jgi:hypothetical protein
VTKTKRLFLASGVLAMAGAATAAHAGCIPITSFPFMISDSGFYCVTADFSVNSDTYKGLSETSGLTEGDLVRTPSPFLTMAIMTMPKPSSALRVLIHSLIVTD